MTKNNRNGEKSKLHDLLFKPDPEITKFFAEPIPWLVLGSIILGILLVILEIIDYVGG